MAPLALFNEGVRAHFFQLTEAPTMRLQNAKNCSAGPLDGFYGFIENHTFFSMMEQFVSMGVQHNLHFYGNVDPLECIFMALLALFDEGVPAHFFHLIEAPTMRLPNEKPLLY